MSELELQMSAGCDPAEEGCEVIEPLVTVEIREDVLEANVPRAPRAFDASVEKVSDAFFVWLTHPPESFWVNLAPTESDRVIEGELGRTDVGQTLLEADLLLKQTAARLLHPDHPSARFWDQLYEWVGARGAKLCHSFASGSSPASRSFSFSATRPTAPLATAPATPTRVPIWVPRHPPRAPRLRPRARCSTSSARRSR